MTGRAIERLFGRPRRTPEQPLEQFHKDVARSLQAVTEEAMLALARRAKEICPSRSLCLAGGVALNCVANGVLLRSGLFDDVFIQPAAGDAGGALGAALCAWHEEFGGARLPRMDHAFLGTEYADEECAAFLRERGVPHERLGERLAEVVSRLLEGENVVGWFQGRMEFGPRALGARSILADARRQENWQRVNLKIKFRESFRPFAPAVLAEKAAEWFAIDRESPYMLLTADVHPDKRALIPAVTHVDGSARLQTVRRDQHPRYHDLLAAFDRRTGCPVVINTSFNVRGEPIVESPQQAFDCFRYTDMDYLALGDCLVRKADLPARLLEGRDAHLARFAPD
jgi:carbamoyltransferase